MSRLRDLINPPSAKWAANDQELYDYLNSVYECLNGLLYVQNPTVLTNSNFNTLSAKGLNPTVPADGDDTEFIGDWFVVGASVADYVITPTVYANNSTVQSASPYFVHVEVLDYTAGDFYFYQRQMSTVRKYQKNFLTYGLQAINNQNKSIKARFDIYIYYDTGDSLKQGAAIYLEPGFNEITSTLLTDSLNGLTVGAGNYTEFRFNFLDLYDGTADIDLNLIKCEFGKISTPLLQQ
jgi:hypothetical protein